MAKRQRPMKHLCPLDQPGELYSTQCRVQGRSGGHADSVVGIVVNRETDELAIKCV